MSARSELSFRDFPTRSDGYIQRKLYMPSHDLQFDLEIERRVSSAQHDTHSTQVKDYSGQLENTDRAKDSAEQTPVKFGLIDPQHTQIDEQVLEKLDIPEPLQYHPGLERELRTSCIFIYNRSIALLKTDQIISHVLHLLGDRSKTFTHLEWVDDFSCVLAFTTNANAIQAFIDLLIRPDEVEGENGLPEAFAYLLSKESPIEVYTSAYEFVCTPRPAKPFSSELFEVNPKNKIHRPSRAEQLIPFIRFAMNFDVKAFSARDKSLFYALNGTRAGHQGVLSKTVNPIIPKTKRMSSHEQYSFDERLSHTELPNLKSTRPLSKSSNLRSKQSRTKITHTLDEELDRFMNQSRGTTPPQQENPRNKSKRGRGEEDEYADGIETQARRQRQKSLPKILKPSIELLPDRPSNCGGNLKDELFSDVQTNWDQQENDRKTQFTTSELEKEPFSERTYHDTNLNEERVDEKLDLHRIKNEHESEYEESMIVAKFNDDCGSSNEHHHQEIHKEDENNLSTDTNNNNEEPDLSTKPNKNRWGPLFGKLVK